MGLATIFLERDLALIEINPLVITKDDDLICLDGKLGVDSNALFRQPEMREMHDPSQEDPREAQAATMGIKLCSTRWQYRLYG